MSRDLLQSTARSVMVWMADSTDHITGKTGLTLTITASKDGAAFAGITPTAVNDRGSGWYEVQLTSTHTNTVGDLALHITGTAADATDLLFQVRSFFSDASVATVGTNVIAAQATLAGVNTVVNVIGAERPVVQTTPPMKLSEATAARRRLYFVIIDQVTSPFSRKTGASASCRARVSTNGAAGTAHAGTFAEVDATNMPGLYYYELTAGELGTLGQLDIQIEYLSGVYYKVGEFRVPVISVDWFDAVRHGMTALPNAAAEAAGGIYTRGSGAGQINQPANGMIDINAVNWRGTAVAIPAVAGVPKVEVGSMGADVLTAAATAADFTTEIQAGLATAANLAIVAAYVDTEVLAIKAKTDNLPSDPVGLTNLAAAHGAGAYGGGGGGGGATATEVRDALLDYPLFPGRTIRGHLRKMEGLFFSSVTGLIGSLVRVFIPDSATELFNVEQDLPNGTREDATIGQSEAP